MNILQVANKAIYPPDGGALAILNLAKGYIRNGHKVHVLNVLIHKHYNKQKIIEKEYQLVKFKWADDEDDSYFEFKIHKDELTGEVALVITDFAEDSEKDDLISLWNSHIAELKHALGF